MRPVRTPSSGLSLGVPERGLDRRMEPCPRRLAAKRGNGVRPGVLFPTELEPGRRQDDGRVRVDLPDVLDQDSSSPRPPKPNQLWHLGKIVFNKTYWHTVPKGRV